MLRGTSHRQALGRALAAGLWLICGSPAFATVLVNIDPGGWEDAMKSGHVQPGPDRLSETSMKFYESQIGVDMFGLGAIREIRGARSVLTPDVPVGNPRQDPGFAPNLNGDDHVFESLLMAWENANEEDPGILNVAQWDYRIGNPIPDSTIALQGPNSFDLSDAHLKFSVRAPRGIWDVSLELFDINGNSIGWFGHPPGRDWINQVIWLGKGMPQGIFSVFVDNPLFDPTQVVLIRLNESTQGGATGFFEINPATGLPGVWNAWNHFKVVVPEPGSLALLALGVLAMGVGFNRRKGSR